MPYKQVLYLFIMAGGKESGAAIDEKNKWGIRILIAALIMITLVCTGITVYLLNRDDQTAAPAYAPQQIDDNARELDNSGDEEKLETQEGGGSVSLTYSASVTVDLAQEKVSVFVENPERSTQDLIIQVLLKESENEEKVIAQSELIPAGYGIDEVDLQEDGLAKGEYDGVIRISYYNPDDGEKAVVNTDIPVTVTVMD